MKLVIRYWPTRTLLVVLTRRGFGMGHFVKPRCPTSQAFMGNA